MLEPNAFDLEISTLIATNTLKMIGVAYWGIVDIKEQAQTTGVFKAAGLGVLLGPAAGAALMMRDTFNSDRVQFKGVLGLVCVTEDVVSLLEIGEIPLIGTTKANASVPQEIIEAIPKLQNIRRLFKFHPLDVQIENGKLVVHSAEQPVRGSKGCSAFGLKGDRIQVFISSSDLQSHYFPTTEQVAEEIGRTLKHLSPDKAMAAVMQGSGPLLEEVEAGLAEEEYSTAFFRTVRRKPMREQKRLFAEAAHSPSQLVISRFESFLVMESRFWRKSSADDLSILVMFTGFFYLLTIVGYIEVRGPEVTDRSLILIPILTFLFGSVPWGLRWLERRRYGRELREFRSQLEAGGLGLK